MKPIEIALLIAGSILFIFSLIIIIVLIKKGEPYIKAIWLIIIAFFMMGFSAISQAEIVGLFKYSKGKDLSTLEIYAEALKYCPDNEPLKEELNAKVIDFEKTKKAKKVNAKQVLSDVYLVLDNKDKAIEYANEVLKNDSTNTKAKEVKKIVETERIIKEIPKSTNKRELIKKYKLNMEFLKSKPAINKTRVKALEYKYTYSMDSLRKVKINQ